MKTYNISYQRSIDGKNWVGEGRTVKAETDVAAIAQIQSMYPYVRNIRINSVR